MFSCYNISQLSPLYPSFVKETIKLQLFPFHFSCLLTDTINTSVASKCLAIYTAVYFEPRCHNLYNVM